MANFRWFFFHVIQVAMADSQTHHLASYNIAAPVTYHRGGALALTGLSLVHDGGRILFQPADISLRHGTITGLVGTNGCGKTSLARILSSKDLPEFPKGLVIEYLAASDDEEYLAGHFTEEDSLSLRPIECINEGGCWDRKKAAERRKIAQENTIRAERARTQSQVYNIPKC